MSLGLHAHAVAVADIDQVARGRIFLARQARELGLVDELGGLSDAIKYAAVEAKLTDYDVKWPSAGSDAIDPGLK